MCDDINTCYIVVARRWGGSETHHYIVNDEMFFDIDMAKILAKSEDMNRGGKYECTVETLRINKGTIVSETGETGV